jgi:putative transposase
VERFNRTYRTEVLDFYLFSSLAEVKEITEDWLKQYNEELPHKSLGNIPPAEYLEINSPQKVSTFGWH